jgi:hypothetical protein
MDELALDHGTIDAQVRAARATKRWRPYGLGASDLPKLFLSLGRRTWQPGDPGYLRDETRIMKSGHPRFLLQKAGVLEKLKRDSAQLIGIRREPELIAAWRAYLETEWFDHPFEAELDPASVGYAMALPDEWPPLVDRECPRLVARLDAWARTRARSLVNVQLKCARYAYRESQSAWWDRGRDCPWWHELQCQAEMAISRARHSLLIVGCGWIRDDGDPRGDGPVKVYFVARNDALIEEIRDAVREGWSRIEALRATALAA